jgi:hypothetical protein
MDIYDTNIKCNKEAQKRIQIKVSSKVFPEPEPEELLY